MENPKPLSSSNQNHLKTSTSNKSSSSSSSVVVLHQWWLINHQSNKLGVGGFFNKETLESLGMRVFGSASAPKRAHLDNKTQEFQSAPILKKLSDNTLEAIDGTIIVITGCINTSRTLSYGFSHQVCNRFLTGFPCTWEDYATHDKCTNTTEKSFPATFDDLRFTQVCDLTMSTTQESESCALTSIIIRDIIKHSTEVLNQNSASVDKVSINATQPELVHLIEKDKIVELHEKDLETCKEAEDTLEDGGLGSNVTPKINQMKRTGSQTRYPLRSTKKKKNS